MFFLRLALLSILKHRRRSIIIAASVLVSVVVMIFVQGMLGGMRRSFFDDLLQESGHLQIHAAGWRNRLDPYSLAVLLRAPDRLAERIKADSRIAPLLDGIEPMLQFGALLVHGERNVAIAGEAVQPDTRFFGDVRRGVQAGAFLPGANPRGPGIAISASIARLLDLKLGDAVVALVQDSGGSPYYLSYPVTGIFSTGKPQTDEEVFFISLHDAQGLLDVPDQASELRITLHDPEAAAPAAQRVSAVLGDQRPEIETWREIGGGLIALIKLGDLYTSVIDLIIVLVAATVITSTILMTVFERIPTFGTLRAIGMKRRQLFWMLMEEGFLLGLIGSILGMAVGLPLVLRLQAHGLDIGAAARMLGTSTTYHFALTPAGALAVAAAGVLIAEAGYLYGALVSVRMRLLDSLDQGV